MTLLKPNTISMNHLSEKQQLANQKNAQKGGVKTVEGKEVSKYNAIRHGILSKESIIRKGDCQEDYELYRSIRDGLFAEINPIGIIETMLVDKLLSYYWRMCRVIKAERALIETQTLQHKKKRELERIKDAEWQKEFPDFYKQLSSSLGCKQLLTQSKLIRDAIDARGLPLDEEYVTKLITELGWKEDLPMTKSLINRHFLVVDKEKLKFPNKVIKNIIKKALQDADELVKYFEERMKFNEKMEEQEDNATAETQLLPNSEDLQRIQRYDAHLYRSFMQTLHELQRMQALRLGKPAPMVAALDIMVNSENGFVS